MAKYSPYHIPIGMRCWRCQKSHEFALGWLKDHDEAACPSCGAILPIDHEGLKEFVLKTLKPREAMRPQKSISPPVRGASAWAPFLALAAILALLGGVSYILTTSSSRTTPLGLFDDVLNARDGLRIVSEEPLTCPYPVYNGDVLTIDRSRSGPHKIEINNGLRGNAIVKVRDASSNRVAISLFVASGGTARFDRLPDGVYRIQYAIGDVLAENCRTFVHTNSADEYPGTNSMVTRRTADAEYTAVSTYTLYAVPNGNVRTRAISVEAFNAD